MKFQQSIIREIAESIVKQSDPGYTTEYMGEYYAVDTDGDDMFDAVMHKESTAPWNPWHDEAVAVAVADLYLGSNASFDPTPDDEFIGDMDPDDDPAYDEAYELAVELAECELPDEYNI